MTTTLWDTTGGDIVKALIAERRAGGAVAAGLAVTFVTIVDEKHIAVAEQAATPAAAAPQEMPEPTYLSGRLP